MGRKTILVRTETNPDDVHGMIAAEGHPHRERRRDVARGGRRARDGQAVRRRLRRAARSTGATKRASLDGKELHEGDWITIDGTTGNVALGELQLDSAAEPSCPTGSRRFLSWADELRRMEVWANADTPEDAAQRARARRAGHRPLPHRAHVHAARAAADRPSDDPGRRRRRAREQALAKLLPFQRDDFIGILKAMEGLPVTIRLLDPPLHEFLPSLEQLLVETTELRLTKGTRLAGVSRQRSDAAARAAAARAESDARPARLPPRHRLSRRSTRCRCARSSKRRAS